MLDITKPVRLKSNHSGTGKIVYQSRKWFVVEWNSGCATEYVFTYTIDQIDDFENVPETPETIEVERWINIYQDDNRYTTYIYDTEKQAINDYISSSYLFARRRINFTVTKGEGLC